MATFRQRDGRLKGCIYLICLPVDEYVFGNRCGLIPSFTFRVLVHLHRCFFYFHLLFQLIRTLSSANRPPCTCQHSTTQKQCCWFRYCNGVDHEVIYKQLNLCI